MGTSNNRTKNAARNMVWGTVNKFVNMFFPFVLRTMMIHILGAEYLGLSSLFTSVLQVLNLAELGVGSAITFSMYKPVAENDLPQIGALLKFYRKIYRIIGLSILLLGLIATPLLPNIIKGECPSDVNIYLLYVIYLINTSASYLLYAYKSCILVANQRNDISSNIASGISISTYIVQIIALYFVHSYYAYVIFLPIFTIISNIIRSVIVDRMFPEYRCEGNLSKEQIKDLGKRVLGLMLFKLSQVFRNSFDSIILSTYLGLVVLGKYQNYYYIMNSVMSFIAIITSAITASIGNSIAVESVEKNLNDIKKFSLLYSWLAGWCAVCLLCLYQPFMKIWLGEEFLFPFYMVVLMSIYFYLLKVGDISAIYREAAGLWWEDKYRPIIESMFNLALNILIVKNFGVAGVVLSTILSILLINIPWASWILFKNYFKTSVVKYWAILIRNAIITVVGAVVTYFVCELLPTDGVISFIGKIAICCFVPNIVFLLLYSRTKEYSDALKLVQKFIPAKLRKVLL